jgi:hypothetical protein
VTSHEPPFEVGPAVVGVLLAVLVIVMLACGGCAATPLARARSLAPVVAEPASKPCVTTLPTPVKLEAIGEPDRLAYLDDAGEAKIALRMTVEIDSLRAFFGYVEALQALAKRAQGCLSR